MRGERGGEETGGEERGGEGRRRRRGEGEREMMVRGEHKLYICSSNMIQMSVHVHMYGRHLYSTRTCFLMDSSSY